MDTSCDIATRHCIPCEGGIAPLSDDAAQSLLQTLAGWSLTDGKIDKTYRFANHYETMAFVNGIALVAHGQDHHPDLSVHYNRCVVRLNTHDVKGLSASDFECAGRFDALLQLA